MCVVVWVSGRREHFIKARVKYSAQCGPKSQQPRGRWAFLIHFNILLMKVLHTFREIYRNLVYAYLSRGNFTYLPFNVYSVFFSLWTLEAHKSSSLAVWLAGCLTRTGNSILQNERLDKKILEHCAHLLFFCRLICMLVLNLQYLFVISGYSVLQKNFCVYSTVQNKSISNALWRTIFFAVSQLRKCYMGARVKKTVREQLEELRTNDNPSEGGTESSGGKYLRVRKRKPDNNEGTCYVIEPFRQTRNE